MRETLQSQSQITHKFHGSFRSHSPCRRIQIPSLIFSAYLQSFLSHWHPAKLLQLLMMGRNIFFLTVQENGTLWDSLYMFNTPSSIQGNVSYSRNVSRHNLSTDFIILLSSTQILESSWICVSFIKHKIRKTVYPILSRFRKKVSFDLFGWTAFLIKKFESRLVFLNLYDG